MPHVDIELEDNKQFISNIPRMFDNFCNGQFLQMFSLKDTLHSISKPVFLEKYFKISFAENFPAYYS